MWRDLGRAERRAFRSGRLQLAEFFSFFTVSRYAFLPLDALARLPAEHIPAIMRFNIGILIMSALICGILAWISLELLMGYLRRQ